jgi:hypothetical protein
VRNIDPAHIRRSNDAKKRFKKDTNKLINTTIGVTAVGGALLEGNKYLKKTKI